MTMSARYVRVYVGPSNIDAWARLNEIQVNNTAGVNVALGIVPTSNFAGVTGLANATNGSTAIGEQTVLAYGYAQYIQIDLGQIHNDIDNFKMWSPWSHVGRAFRRKIFTSLDGIEWTKVYDTDITGLEHNDNGVPTVVNAAPMQFPPRLYDGVRYIRLWHNGNSVDNTNSVIEIYALRYGNVTPDKENAAFQKQVIPEAGITSANLVLAVDNLMQGDIAIWQDGNHYVTVDLGSTRHDIMSLWIYGLFGRSWDRKVEISSDNVNYKLLFEGVHLDDATGHKIPLGFVPAVWLEAEKITGKTHAKCLTAFKHIPLTPPPIKSFSATLDTEIRAEIGLEGVLNSRATIYGDTENLTPTSRQQGVSFSMAADGALPIAWTPRWNTSTTVWAKRTKTGIGAWDNAVLECTGTGTSARRMITYDPFNATSGDFDMILRWRSTDADTTNVLARLMAFAAGTDNQATHNSYHCYFVGDKTFRLGKYVNNTFTVLGNVPIPDYVIGDWQWFRFRRRGTTLMAKMWSAYQPEHVNFQIVIADTSHSSGWMGIGAGEVVGAVRDFDHWSIGTGALLAIMPNALSGGKASGKSKVNAASLELDHVLETKPIKSNSDLVGHLIKFSPLESGLIKSFSTLTQKKLEIDAALVGSIKGQSALKSVAMTKSISLSADPIKAKSKVNAVNLIRSVSLSGLLKGQSTLKAAVTISSLASMSANIKAFSKIKAALERVTRLTASPIEGQSSINAARMDINLDLRASTHFQSSVSGYLDRKDAPIIDLSAYVTAKSRVQAFFDIGYRLPVDRIEAHSRLSTMLGREILLQGQIHAHSRAFMRVVGYMQTVDICVSINRSFDRDISITTLIPVTIDLGGKDVDC